MREETVKIALSLLMAACLATRSRLDMETSRASNPLFGPNRFKLGVFDPPEMVKYARTPYSDNDSPAHAALALETLLRPVLRRPLAGADEEPCRRLACFAGP